MGPKIGKMFRGNETLREMIPGILAYGLLIQIIVAVFFPLRLYRAIGLWAGIFCGVAMAVHMAFCLEKVVMLDEKGATAYARKTTLIRYGCVCLVLLLIAFLKVGDPVTMVLGILGLKIGAYLQPFVHSIIRKFSHKHDSEEGE